MRWDDEGERWAVDPLVSNTVWVFGEQVTWSGAESCSEGWFGWELVGGFAFALFLCSWLVGKEFVRYTSLTLRNMACCNLTLNLCICTSSHH
jgi:hypothetical protein